ncbi:hypothetical protein DID73_00380 [Candidatus Marinamargulisbacteria bacterium SCGC AG-343-K17]|nr:hypothetical protein DID73_00380 [Candidatus Marinamargulisbacteria bacterium SCGC AG-343-K17]
MVFYCVFLKLMSIFYKCISLDVGFSDVRSSIHAQKVLSNGWAHFHVNGTRINYINFSNVIYAYGSDLVLYLPKVIEKVIEQCLMYSGFVAVGGWPETLIARCEDSRLDSILQNSETVFLDSLGTDGCGTGYLWLVLFYRAFILFDKYCRAAPISGYFIDKIYIEGELLGIDSRLLSSFKGNVNRKEKDNPFFFNKLLS